MSDDGIEQNPAYDYFLYPLVSPVYRLIAL